MPGIDDGESCLGMDSRDKFGADDKREWGTCSSPLVAEGKLIINPGGKDASLVALDPKTGKDIWKTPGKPASYGSFMGATFGGKQKIVGCDFDSLGGWDAKTGKRLWRLAREYDSKFNVPTPIRVGERLLVALENNGTRVDQFNANVEIDPKPVAKHRDLSLDSHMLVVVGDRVFGIWSRLFCLNLKSGLNEVWDSDDRAFGKYVASVASDNRVLAITLEGELILLDPQAAKFDLISRLKVFPDEAGLYSHPAFVETRMYVRGSSSLVCGVEG